MISHKYKCIFVHVPKTGGQSVELVFVHKHNLTWATNDELLLGGNKDRKAGPQRLAHLYASEYVPLGYISEKLFKAYTKFAVVRNPYERMVSEFNYRRNNDCTKLRDFIEIPGRRQFSDRSRHAVPQTRYLYAPSGKLLVDRIVRFEQFHTALPVLLSEIVGEPIVMPHRNGPKTIRLRPEDLDEEDLRFVEEAYAEDFEAFGYPKMPRKPLPSAILEASGDTA